MIRSFISSSIQTGFFAAAAVFVLIFSGATTARAQVGTGWKQYSPSYYVQIETHGAYTNHPPGNHYTQEGASYDKANGIETFKLTSTASNRVEIRTKEEYSSGQRQFVGDIRVSKPTNDESVFQVFHVMLLRAMAKNNGSFDWHLHNVPTKSIGSNFYGQWVHINVIHDANSNHITLYVNGSNKGRQPNPDQTMYLKYGVYGSLKTSSAKIEWKNVKFFRK